MATTDSAPPNPVADGSASEGGSKGPPSSTLEMASIDLHEYDGRPTHFNYLIESTGRVSFANKTVLVLDPGLTTGIAVFHQGLLVAHGQATTEDVALGTNHFSDLIDHFRPDILVVEEYRVYSWRAKHHAWSDLVTSRLVGCAETLAAMKGLPRPTMQSAQVAKQFCTDDKLKKWGMWHKGMQHARDATRHGCYYLLFHKEKVGNHDRQGKGRGSHVG